MNKILLGRRYAFSAMHSIPQEDFVHGHNYSLDISVSGPIEETADWICSRDQLDDLVQKAFLLKVDRRWINDLVLPATGEKLAEWAFNEISRALPSSLKLEKLELHETRKNSFKVMSLKTESQAHI